MKKTSKKFVGGIMAVMFIATIGAVVASAQPGIFSELTDEQKDEMKDLRETLTEEGATCEEIRDAATEQLESYGIELPTREEMIDKRIEQTEQRLEILQRTKELIEENPDITQEEIRDTIQEEFDLELPEEGKGMMHKGGFRRGFGGPRGCMPSEEVEEI